ncbi:MAG: helix-turn-helix domain-containing protein [Deltaproteobacteria bacterium]
MPKQTTDLPNDLVAVPQAARRLGIHPESLYRLIREGQFPPAVHIGRQIRVSVPRLEQFLHGDDAVSA